MCNIFDDHWQRFLDEQLKPWGQIRYRVAFANLKRHLPQKTLRVLDAGGGNGLDALALARQGYRVTLLDPSAEMLEVAREQAEKQHVAECFDTLQGNLDDLALRFEPGAFDLVLCHNVIQYLPEIAPAVRLLLNMLATGGLLSIISLNRYSEAFRQAVQQMDLQAARAAINAHALRTVTFDAPIQTYAGEEIAEALTGLGCEVVGRYGIRCVCDYISDNERKFEPEFFAQLEELEHALSAEYPYYLLARNFQIIARKQGV